MKLRKTTYPCPLYRGTKKNAMIRSARRAAIPDPSSPCFNWIIHPLIPVRYLFQSHAARDRWTVEQAASIIIIIIIAMEEEEEEETMIPL